MTKPPERATRGAGKTERGSSWESVPRGPLCPNSPDCRRLIAEASAPQTADCWHCGQTLTRADLAKMLEGQL